MLVALYHLECTYILIIYLHFNIKLFTLNYSQPISDENFNLTPNEDFSLVHNMPPEYQLDQLEKVMAVVAKVHIYGGQSEEDDILGSLQVFFCLDFSIIIKIKLYTTFF